MDKLRWRVVFLLSLFFTIVPVPTHAAEKIAAKEAVVLMPMRPTKDIPQDEMTQYEAALVKSLSEKYVVYSGQRVIEKVNAVYMQRSGEAKAGKECDETKCLQDVAMAFQTKEGVPFIGIANIRKASGGYSISLKITDVVEDKVAYSAQKPCEGCNEFKVMDLLRTLAGGGTVSQPIVETPASQETSSKKVEAGSSSNEVAIWKSVKDSVSLDDIDLYLQAYPNGAFSTAAKNRKDALKKAAADKAAADKAAEEEAARVAAEKAAAEEAARIAEERDVADKFTAMKANPPAGMVAVERENGGFFIDKTEVTQEAYQRVMGKNRSYNECATCPVEKVNWDEATAYCGKVGKRLPTSDEWQYAATSGGKSEIWAGANNVDKLGDYAWHRGNSGFIGMFSHPVGKKKPNGLGLYDMSGNVKEWTDSWYDKEHKYRLVRGGSYLQVADELKSARREYAQPFDSDMELGFRCAQ